MNDMSIAKKRHGYTPGSSRAGWKSPKLWPRPWAEATDRWKRAAEIKRLDRCLRCLTPIPSADGPYCSDCSPS